MGRSEISLNARVMVVFRQSGVGDWGSVVVLCNWGSSLVTREFVSKQRN